MQITIIEHQTRAAGVEKSPPVFVSKPHTLLKGRNQMTNSQIKTALKAIQGMLEEARGELQNLVGEMESTSENRSEAWHATGRGEKYLDNISELNNMADDIGTAADFEIDFDAE